MIDERRQGDDHTMKREPLPASEETLKGWRAKADGGPMDPSRRVVAEFARWKKPVDWTGRILWSFAALVLIGLIVATVCALRAHP